MSSFIRQSFSHRSLWGFLHRKIRTKQPFQSICRRQESTASSSSSPQFKAKKSSMLSPTMILLGFVPIFTFALGTWQLERLKWKVNLIDELEEKLQLDPLVLPRHINLSVVPDFAYRKVLLKGKCDYEHVMLVGPRVYSGTHGYHLVVPLVRSDGTTVLVDRGFISQEIAESKSWAKDDGEVYILGMLRTTQVRNKFTPDNHPEKGQWYWSDVPGMAEYAGGEKANVQPVYVEEIFEGHAGEASSRLSQGIPVGRPATVDVRNSHASYVVTWYSLSALTAVMFIRLLLKQRRASSRLPR